MFVWEDGRLRYSWLKRLELFFFSLGHKTRNAAFTLENVGLLRESS